MKILEGTYRLVSVKHTQVLGCISITTETRTQFQVRRSISRIDSNDRHGCLLGLGVYGYAVSRVRRHVTIHYIHTYEFIQDFRKKSVKSYYFREFLPRKVIKIKKIIIYICRINFVILIIRIIICYFLKLKYSIAFISNA